MKYETTQGQYATFLNSISPTASQARANFGGKDYYENRGTIRFSELKYFAGSPLRPCNFFSWDDACAFADWACLRPMTELEFEKACRGPQKPIAHEFPWNTDNKNKLQRVVTANGDLVWLNGLKESELTDNNRDMYGASYYWVMDLAGSLWERCVTIGDSTGRAFKGTHGDGALTGYGFASNADWPKGSTETAGFGFKGGGYYENQRMYGAFNPHGPIGYRNFAAWPGGGRSIAYGSRLVRTAAMK
jgi:formylglycine-generating enzyme required for sulfatase activity